MVLDLRAGPGFDPQPSPPRGVVGEPIVLSRPKPRSSPTPMKAGRNFLGPSNERGGRKREGSGSPGTGFGRVTRRSVRSHENGSFDPADYILPTDQNESMPYRVLFEVNQPNDPSSKTEDQPSLVYEVEVIITTPHLSAARTHRIPEAEEVEEKRNGLSLRRRTNPVGLTSSTAPFCKSNASPEIMVGIFRFA